MSIDFTSNNFGNLRCWEALNVKSCMITNEGFYPKGFDSGLVMHTFNPRNPLDLIKKINFLLSNEDLIDKTSNNGYKMLKKIYNKESVFSNFLNLL